MNDRARAIAILRQAREILAGRLTERILDAQEELLDDARGLTWCGEIDNVYEQLALRLSHVNSMLSNLPPEEEPVRLALAYKPANAESAPAFQIGSTEVLTVRHEATAMPTTVTFELFGRQVLCDELEWAGRSLAVLLAVDEALGRRCALAFHARLRQSPELITRLVQLRRELQDGSIHGPLKLLQECFGLEGLEALSVLQTLRARLIGHNEAA
jgi:hypothetical protein